MAYQISLYMHHISLTLQIQPNLKYLIRSRLSTKRKERSARSEDIVLHPGAHVGAGVDKGIQKLLKDLMKYSHMIMM